MIRQLRIFTYIGRSKIACGDSLATSNIFVQSIHRSMARLPVSWKTQLTIHSRFSAMMWAASDRRRIRFAAVKHCTDGYRSKPHLPILLCAGRRASARRVSGA